MKKLLSLLLLIVFVCTALVSFSGCFLYAPFQSVSLSANTPSPLRVYVSGAVEHSGYYFVDVGSSYYSVLQQAGILPESYIKDANYIVTEKGLFFVVNYISDGVNYSCVNVNGLHISQRQAINDIPQETINVLADYIELHGKICNNAQLQDALGDSYYKCFYKFFISEVDYETFD